MKYRHISYCVHPRRNVINCHFLIINKFTIFPNDKQTIVFNSLFEIIITVYVLRSDDI